MLKLMMTTAALLLSLSAFTQFRLNGKVSDAESHEPMPGATVVLENQTFITDPLGNFRIDNVAPGSYTLEVRFIGYATNRLPIAVTENQEVEIFLERQTTITDEVIVSATRAHEKTPIAFANVTRDELSKQNVGQDMPYVLNFTPSLVTTSDAGAGIGYTGVRIRGSDATRINVTINGIPYNDSESQGTFWVNIPDIVSSTESVQIQRGVGTSTNGAGSFGGSVNLQTLSLQQKAYTELITGVGSFNTKRLTLKGGTGLIHDHWSFDARVSKITSDGYIDRASSNLSSYYLSAGYHGKNSVVKAIVFGGSEKTYQSWNGVDEATLKTNRTFNSAGALYDGEWNVTGYYDNEVDDYTQDHYQLHYTQTINEHWHSNISLHYTYGRGFFEQYKQAKPFEELGLSNIVIGDSTITGGDFIVRRWLDNDFYGTTFSLNYENTRMQFVLGGGINRYGNAKHFGEIMWAQYASNSSIRQHYYDGESQKDDVNLYAKANYDLSQKLNVFVDLQIRNVKYETAGLDDDRASYAISDKLMFFNPKAGLSYTLNTSNVLYGSYAVANREPNRNDYLEGDVKPKAERLHNVELGWRYNKRSHLFGINYYLMNYYDQLVLTGELDDVGNPIRANVGRSYRTGIELSGSLSVSDQIKWSPNVTYSINKNIDYVGADGTKSKTDIILSPSLIGGSQLSFLPRKGLELALLTKYVGQQYLDNSQSEILKLDDYLLNDIRLSYSFPLKNVSTIGVVLMVNNVFNVAYSSNGYSYDGLPYYYPQAGTNYFVSLNIRL